MEGTIRERAADESARAAGGGSGMFAGTSFSSQVRALRETAYFL